MKRFPFILVLFGLSVAALADLTVFSAASATDAMRELAAAFERGGGERVRFNVAGSGALARQIDAGAAADLFVSANAAWMDWLEKKGAVEKATRFNLASNRLVLIAPKGSALVFDGKVPGRVAVGDFRSVPAGIYAKEALAYMGWLEDWRPGLVTGSSVRTVLMYVERGEVAAGIVYATDARASGNVPVVGIFPPESHAPIVYPVAACTKKESAFAFLAFLKSDKAKAVLKKHGFADAVE